VLADRWGASGNQSWRLQVATGGSLQWSTTANGSTAITETSTASLTALANGTPLFVAVTHDVDNGASGHSVRFWTSPTGVTWTQLGTTVVTATVTSIFSTAASTQPLTVGSTLIGDAISASLRTGIGAAGVVGGTEVAAWTPEITTDSYGNVWTVSGAPAAGAAS
jgi:hypothetical protein